VWCCVEEWGNVVMCGVGGEIVSQCQYKHFVVTNCIGDGRLEGCGA